LPHLHRAEQAIAAAILDLRAGGPPWPEIETEKAIAWAEGKLGVTLAPGQRTAVGTALGAKVVVITGGPGVGKTTIIRSILHISRPRA
jgi:exodeoxyribonuclease V alpha subunit